MNWKSSAEGIPYKTEPWRDWYAWRPIRIEGNLVWCESVQRRRVHYDCPLFGEFSSVQYRFKWPRP